MISTTHLTADQLTQLEALLASTTPGGSLYRPRVAQDVEVLEDLECAGLARWTHDCGYEITDTGRAAVVDHAMDAAASEAFVRCASSFELREAIRKLRAVVDEFADDDELRERTLMDIEACQDALDGLADTRTCWAPGDQEHDHEMCNDVVAERAEGTGRHRVVPADDRPTETIARVELPTEPLPVNGTLPSIPVAEILADRDGAERLLVAIQDMPGPADIVEFLAEQHTADEWAALEADLSDESGWWRRNLTPRRVLALSVIASVVVTWFVAWLVMA